MDCVSRNCGMTIWQKLHNVQLPLEGSRHYMLLHLRQLAWDMWRVRTHLAQMIDTMHFV